MRSNTAFNLKKKSELGVFWLKYTKVKGVAGLLQKIFTQVESFSRSTRAAPSHIDWGWAADIHRKSKSHARLPQ